MSQARARITLDLPINDVWQRLRNLGCAHCYVPGIKATAFTTAQREGVGTSRTVTRAGGATLQETVIDWQDGRGFTLRLHKGDKDAPFANARFIYSITAIGDHQTRLDTTMEYTPPMGKVGRWLDRVILHRIITGIVGDVAASLKHFHETGITPSAGQRRALRGALERRGD